MTFRDYRRQTLATIPDACIFTALGTNIPFVMGYTSNNVSDHFRVSLFIGLIAGILASTLLMKYLLKRHFELLSSVLVIVAAILNIAWPNDEIKSIPASYINGIGTGLIIVPFIVQCSETAITRQRGYALGLEQVGIAVGYFLQVTYYEIDRMYYKYVLSAPRMHGIYCLCFGLIAFGATMVVELPIFSKSPNNNVAALYPSTKLELPAVVLSEEKNHLMEEQKNYVSQNEVLGLGASFVQGLGPLFRMILYRIAIALTFSDPFATELQIGTFWGVTQSYLGSQWTIGLSLMFRVLGVFAGRKMSDPIGRKIVGFGGLVGMCGTAIAVAVMFKAGYYAMSTAELKMVCLILILMQFVAGLHAATSTIYLSEAFPMLVKPYFIAICLCLENAVQIALLFVFRYRLVETFNIFTAAYLVGCTVLFLFTLPETKLTTLTEAQERFRAWKHFRSW